jgi:hypothetical protein
MSTTFLTSPTVTKDKEYGKYHPIRVIARTMLRYGGLEPEQFAFVRSCPGCPAPTEQANRTDDGNDSALDDILAGLRGTFRLQLSPEPCTDSPLSYRGREIVSLTWLAPWAICALRQADYVELDCSFKALKPYVYSIPLAVKANSGIPLGIVMAPSERQAVFSLFADVLAEKGFSRRDLFELPLLSDAGTALRSYAEGNAEREGYHRHHYLCHRHLLESIGSGTIVALIARRLIFTTTEAAFKDIYPQTIADFVLGCRQNLISAPGRRKFAELFGVDLAGWTGNGSPRTNITDFKRQAL